MMILRLIAFLLTVLGGSIKCNAVNVVSSISTSNRRSLHEEGHDETVVNVGNVRPEGSHALSRSDVVELGLLPTDHSYVLITEILNGGVNVLNVNTQQYTNLIPSVGFQERGGFGVFYTLQHILVASIGNVLNVPAEIYIYNPLSATPAEPVVICRPTDAGLPVGTDAGYNDMDIVDDVAYVTDSTHNRLWNFNVSTVIASGNCTGLLNFVELDDEVFNGVDTETPIRSNGMLGGRSMKFNAS